jgi:hypothetical protein
MSNKANETKDFADAAITRRRMLMKLGLAAGAMYAAPMLVPLSEARASSGPSGPSGSRGRGHRRRRGQHSWTKPSFSRSRGKYVRRPLYGETYPDYRIRVGSFSRR